MSGGWTLPSFSGIRLAELASGVTWDGLSESEAHPLRSFSMGFAVLKACYGFTPPQIGSPMLGCFRVGCAGWVISKRHASCGASLTTPQPAPRRQMRPHAWMLFAGLAFIKLTKSKFCDICALCRISSSSLAQRYSENSVRPRGPAASKRTAGNSENQRAVRCYFARRSAETQVFCRNRNAPCCKFPARTAKTARNPQLLKLGGANEQQSSR